MTTLKDWARRLGGDCVNGEVRAPGPGHSRRDRSLAVRPDRARGFVVHSFAGDDPLACRDHVAELLGFAEWRDRVRPVAIPQARPEPDVTERIARAMSIWDEARAPIGTPVIRYLLSRGVELWPEAMTQAIRYHARCPFGQARVPCMVALVRDASSMKPIGIHRTALNLSGQKVTVDGKDRAALGVTKNGVVTLTPSEDVTYALALGEGLESSMSLRRLPEFGPSPVWACLNATNLGAFPILSGIESLWIAVDRDEAGERAADEVTERWTSAGREVLRVEPTTFGFDVNDLIREVHHD